MEEKCKVGIETGHLARNLAYILSRNLLYKMAKN
jgi:hypothetical protein